MTIKDLIKIITLCALYCPLSISMRTQKMTWSGNPAIAVRTLTPDEKLMAAVKENNAENTVAALREKANPNFSEMLETGETVSMLHYAMKHKNAMIIEWLLAAGAQINPANLPLLRKQLEQLAKEKR